MFQMSFGRETSGGGVVECRLFSQASLLSIYDVQDCNGVNASGTLHHTQNNPVTDKTPSPSWQSQESNQMNENYSHKFYINFIKVLGSST